MWIAWPLTLGAGLSLLTLPFVLLQRREPMSTVAWALLVLLLPYVGPGVFFLWSWNHPKRTMRLFRRKQRAFAQVTAGSGEGSSEAGLASPEGFGALARSLADMGGFPPRGGNSMEFFREASETRAAVLQVVAGAERHVHLEYYIFETGDAGWEVIEALCERARGGVECRLLLEAVGSLWFSGAAVERLRRAGRWTS